MSAVVEQSQVRWGRTTISYAIRRSNRRATVAVTVAPSGAVVLTAPTDTPIERLDRIVHEKARWITGRLRLAEPAKLRPPAREFVSGETFLYLGRQYRLDVRRAGGPTSVTLERGRFRVQVHSAADELDRAVSIRTALVSWYREHAEARLPERVAWWAGRLKLAPPKVLVRDQAKRWGSCKDGTVRFNWRMVQAPMRLVDYVVAHELVHLQHDNHSRAFWSALGRVMPDYEIRREDLRQLGARLEW